MKVSSDKIKADWRGKSKKGIEVEDNRRGAWALSRPLINGESSQW